MTPARRPVKPAIPAQRPTNEHLHLLLALDRLEFQFHYLSRITRSILKLEVIQVAFSQDVLDRIARQTTIIASIKAWIVALPANEVPQEAKDAILANLDANEAELNTAIPVNTPPVDPNAPA